MGGKKYAKNTRSKIYYISLEKEDKCYVNSKGETVLENSKDKKHVLRRIYKIQDGTLVQGWYIEYADNLFIEKGDGKYREDDECWIDNDAKVFGCVCVGKNAILKDNVIAYAYKYPNGYSMHFISGNVVLKDRVKFVNSVTMESKVNISGDAEIINSSICDDAVISENVKITESYISNKTVLKGNLEVNKSHIDMFTSKELSGDGVIFDDAYIESYKEFEKYFKSKPRSS